MPAQARLRRSRVIALSVPSHASLPFKPTFPGYAERNGARTLVALMQQTLMVMHGKPDDAR